MSSKRKQKAKAREWALIWCGMAGTEWPVRYEEVAVDPAAELFPLMQGKELEDLAANIQANGLINPIPTHKGVILDGRNRYRACLLAGVRPTCKEVDFK